MNSEQNNIKSKYSNASSLNDVENEKHLSTETRCILAAEDHCITCSDQAVPVIIHSVDDKTGIAVVMVQGKEEEIDITLIDNVSSGDVVLVHGGVAVSLYTAGEQEDIDLFLQEREQEASDE